MLKKILVALVGLISFIYLINPGMGIFELIPDSLPLIGNLDEAAAAVLLLSALKYFGIDLTRFFMRDKIGK
ncbi:DUF1232 domain-containing protein [Thermodesulfobacteriota bacterium]